MHKIIWPNDDTRGTNSQSPSEADLGRIQPLTIIIKSSTLDVASVLDPLLTIAKIQKQSHSGLQCSYFFCQYEPQLFLFLLLFIHVLINCNLHSWQLLHTWPVGETGNFPFQKGKKNILKNFPKHINININMIYIFPSIIRASPCF